MTVKITKPVDVNEFFNTVRSQELSGKDDRQLAGYFERLCKIPDEEKTPEDYLRIGYMYGWVLIASTIKELKMSDAEKQNHDSGEGLIEMFARLTREICGLNIK